MAGLREEGGAFRVLRIFAIAALAAVACIPCTPARSAYDSNDQACLEIADGARVARDHAELARLAPQCAKGAYCGYARQVMDNAGRSDLDMLVCDPTVVQTPPEDVQPCFTLMGLLDAWIDTREAKVQQIVKSRIAHLAPLCNAERDPTLPCIVLYRIQHDNEDPIAQRVHMPRLSNPGLVCTISNFRPPG